MAASAYLAPAFRVLETYVPNFNTKDASEFTDWFVSFRNPRDIWASQPSFLIIECLTLFIVFCNYVHARRCGGRYVYFWWSTMVVSWFTELVCYFVPDLNNFWHSQSMVMFTGKRYPLYIVLMYNVFYYPSFVAVSKLNLKWWAQPFAVGLLSVLMDIPYDIMGVKMLWWSWHDTDPAILDRFYNVPWTSLHFHCAFSAAMVLVFLGLKSVFGGNKWERGNSFMEYVVCVLAGLAGMPVGSLFFTLLYHPLKDRYGIHSEVPVLMFLGACLYIVWTGDRWRDRRAVSKSKGKSSSPSPVGFSLAYVGVMLHFAFQMVLVVYAKPELVRAKGLHQELGKCGVVEHVFSMAGKQLPREKYLCPAKYDEPYLDFHCLPGKAPEKGASNWYTMCGTPFSNHVEYISIVWFFCILGMLTFTQLFMCNNSINGGGQSQSGQSQSGQSQSAGSRSYYEKHGSSQKRQQPAGVPSKGR